MKYPRILLILIFVVLVAACSNDEEEVSLAELVGVYQLQSAKVTFEDGSVVALSSDKDEISGSFTIESSGEIVQELTVTGVDKIYVITGTIENVVQDKLYVKSGGCSYHVPFNYRTSSGKKVLTTNLQKGTCGAEYTEEDVWVKTEQSSKKPAEETLNDDAVTGGVIGNIMRLF